MKYFYLVISLIGFALPARAQYDSTIDRMEQEQAWQHQIDVSNDYQRQVDMEQREQAMQMQMQEQQEQLRQQQMEIDRENSLSPVERLGEYR